MRLICPNCDAQYEVPAEVIPEGGRDVQCSNCGHIWYQNHPDDPVEADAPATAEIDDRLPDEADSAYEDEDDVAPEVRAPRQRSIDPSVKQVLREEAEREVARRRSGGTLESQPELGLDQPPETEDEKRARQARERMARIKGQAVGEAAPAQDAAEDDDPKPGRRGGARSALLPDIDEINQSLRAEGERRPVETPQGKAAMSEEPRSGGFARGFAFVILIAVVLAGLYVAAPKLAEAVPALADPLAAYVSAVDEGRLWIDRQIGAARGMVETMGAPEGETSGMKRKGSLGFSVDDVRSVCTS